MYTTRQILYGIPNPYPEDAWWIGIVDSPYYYPVLYQVVRAINPRSILEIGTHYGYGACTMVKAASALKTITCIDNQSYGVPLGYAEENIRYCCDSSVSVKVINADSHSVKLREICVIGGYDLVYVDGDHSPEGCDMDLRLALSVVSDGGWILVDDTESSGLRQTVMDRLGIFKFFGEIATRILTEPRGLMFFRIENDWRKM